MGRSVNVFPPYVKMFRSPSVWGGRCALSRYLWWQIEMLGFPWCGGYPCGTCCYMSVPAVWEWHWHGITQQLLPGVMVGTHQTLTTLSFRLQGRYSRYFWTSQLFMVRSHKTLLTLSRAAGTEKRDLLAAPVTAYKHPGTKHAASAWPELRTHKKCRLMLVSACPFPVNSWRGS